MSSDWPNCGFTIVIDPPDTAGNFKGFNVECDVLDSDFLMQPVNEADYDSETQACVDRQTGVTSFYDHYVTKRRKKKGLKGVGIECPAPPLRCAPPESTSTLPAQPPPPPSSASCLESSGGRISHQNHQVPLAVPVSDSNLLAPPSRLAVPKGALGNVAVRRIACGRMPPRQDEAVQVMAASNDQQLREVSALKRSIDRSQGVATSSGDTCAGSGVPTVQPVVEGGCDGCSQVAESSPQSVGEKEEQSTPSESS